LSRANVLGSVKACVEGRDVGTFLVTGASSGIGAAVAQQLRAVGHVLTGVALEGADIEANLVDPLARALAVTQAQTRCAGGLDGLVCSAGLGPSAPAADVVSLNYFATLAFLDGLFPLLQHNAPAAAVVLASTGAAQISGDHPLVQTLLSGDEPRSRAEASALGDGMLAYCASKHALTVAVRQRAWAWGQAGVRLNAVAPGPVETPLLHQLETDERIPSAVRQFLPPVGRKGHTGEIAEFIDYLLSPRAGFIHGSLLFIDGGIDALTRPRSF